MSLADIWNWISSNVASAWNWLIHVDLLVDLQYLGFLVLAVLVLAFLGFVVGQYNAFLATAYQRHPRLMGKVYRLTLISMAVFGVLFVAGLVLLFFGIEVPGAWVVLASFFMAPACLLAAMLLRKPEKHA